MGMSVLLLLLLLLILASSRDVEAKCGEDAVIFTFGDSNADTGGLTASLGYEFPLPYGRFFFHRATGRTCDGRLVLDFLCESLNTSYLNPYLDPLGSGFRNGANFAIAGSATSPKYQPFSLYIQTRQFLRFRARSLELVSQGSRNLINEEKFLNALYIIDIGHNDLSKALSSKLTYDQLMRNISGALLEIKDAIKTIYGTGGRNFWVHNTGPLGCLPQKLALPRKPGGDLDPNGCLISFNNASKEFNVGLSTLCDELTAELKDATIVYVDVYTIKYDIIANHAKYGFKNPLMACCGHGGSPYNYNPNITCGNPGAHACQEGLRFVNWDGVHYTEAANSIIASRILSAKFSKPEIKFDFFCNA